MNEVKEQRTALAEKTPQSMIATAKEYFAKNPDEKITYFGIGRYNVPIYRNNLELGERDIAEALEKVLGKKKEPTSKDPSANQEGEVFECSECGEQFETLEEAITLYECGDCGVTFSRENSANDNHQCPDCFKFGSVLTKQGCPECQEGELEEGETETVKP